MISRVPFHEGNSLALHSVSNDDSRPIAHVLCLFQRFDYLAKIETVNLEDMPVESLPLVGEWLHGHYLFSQTVLLNPVSIDYGGFVFRVLFFGPPCRFPSLVPLPPTIPPPHRISRLLLLCLFHQRPPHRYS